MIIDDSSDFLEWAYFILEYLKSEGISYWIDYGSAFSFPSVFF